MTPVLTDMEAAAAFMAVMAAMNIAFWVFDNKPESSFSRFFETLGKKMGF